MRAMGSSYPLRWGSCHSGRGCGGFCASNSVHEALDGTIKCVSLTKCTVFLIQWPICLDSRFTPAASYVPQELFTLASRAFRGPQHNLVILAILRPQAIFESILLPPKLFPSMLRYIGMDRKRIFRVLLPILLLRYFLRTLWIYKVKSLA